MERLISDSRLNDAERRWQQSFSFRTIAGALLIAAAVLLACSQWAFGPDRTPLPPRTVALHFERLALPGNGAAPLRLAGAWRMTADDPRFGGLSALAVDGGRLLALSDSGVLARFSPPGGPATVDISELPDGPGSPLRKQNRDSEALARDPYGRGWWVAFEKHNQLWLYDAGFSHGVRAIDFGRKRWSHNLGIEAMLVDKGRITLVPEPGHEVVDVGAGRAVSQPLIGADSRISDLARTADGTVLVLLRDVGMTGFRNSIGVLSRHGPAWRVERRIRLAVGMFANLEGLAAEPLPDGRTRLWLVTDDNFQPPLTTMLVALDVPASGWPH